MSDIAPDDFDLQEALQQHSTTDDSDRKRCPECLSSMVQPNSGKYDLSDCNYFCEECGNRFDDPETGLSEAEVRERA